MRAAVSLGVTLPPRPGDGAAHDVDGKWKGEGVSAGTARPTTEAQVRGVPEQSASIRI